MGFRGRAMTTVAEALIDRPRRRGRPLVAWAAILLAVATAYAGQRWLPRTVEARKQASNAVLEFQGRALVAAGELDPTQRAKALQEVQPSKDWPVPEKLRFVVLAGELAG